MNEKLDANEHLLARVLNDARDAQDRSARTLWEARERIVLKNQELFQRYTELTNGRHLIAYFARVELPSSAMTASDVAPITALFNEAEKIGNLDLLIHSPGGQAQTAEEIVAACRRVRKARS